jgi:hypothetical protein
MGEGRGGRVWQWRGDLFCLTFRWWGFNISVKPYASLVPTASHPQQFAPRRALHFRPQYFVKTLKKGETRLLFAMLQSYYKHVASHPHTLITKFYGLHRITLANGRKVRAVSEY